MLLTGVIFNAGVVAVGSLLGLLLRRGLPVRVMAIITQGLGLCVLYVGVSGMLVENNIIVTVLSVVLGAILGELLHIEKGIAIAGDKLSALFKTDKREGSFAEGFVSATLFTCVGAVGILGALQSGLRGIHDTFFFKGIVDAIFALVMASTLGPGVCFSAIPIFLYQSVLTLSASALSGLLSDTVVNAISCVGSLLIVGIALNMLKITNIKVANLLPAPFFPILLHLFF